MSCTRVAGGDWSTQLQTRQVTTCTHSPSGRTHPQFLLMWNFWTMTPRQRWIGPKFEANAEGSINNRSVFYNFTSDSQKWGKKLKRWSCLLILPSQACASRKRVIVMPTIDSKSKWTTFYPFAVSAVLHQNSPVRHLFRCAHSILS